jgi:prepilin-type N-terminal cleavage/methylation domain-containing protein
MTDRKTTQAFTLLELIIVMSIIALLAMAATVSYAKIQSKARRTKCQKNLSQLVSGIMNYAGENRSILPPHQMSGGGDNPDRWWGYDAEARQDADDDLLPADIWEYAGGTQAIFECPGKVSEFEFNPRSIGYGYNAWFLGWSDGGTGSPTPQYDARPRGYTSLGRVRDASSMLVFGDSVYHSSGSGGKKGAYVLWYPDMRSGAYDGVDMSHRDLGCVGFLDGHTGDFKTQEINPVDGTDKLSYWDPRKGKYSDQPD